MELNDYAGLIKYKLMIAMTRLIETWRMDRTAWSVESLAEQGKDRKYWLSRDPAERLAAIELARQIYYGYDPSTARLQRVYSTHKLGES
jgi:hypothetical protein